MDNIPIEVWNHIFLYACSDGGRTGAALASTSILFSTISAPYRFHSLKLTSLSQIGKLLLCHERMIRNSSTAAPGRSERSAALDARHLLLAFLPGECDAPARPWRGWSEYSQHKHKREHEIVEDSHAWESSKAAWDRQFEYLVPRLFQLIGPTLETLAVLQHADVALPYVGGRFPRLRELSLLADDHLFVLPEPHWDRTAGVGIPEREELAWFWDQAALFPPFPALTHLHVVYEGPKRIAWEKTLPLWGKLAPEVTHVRVSQASKLMPEVLDGIATTSFAQVQGQAAARGSPPAARKRVSFAKLQRAIVQPLVLDPVRGYEYLEEIETLRRAPKARGGPTVVVMKGRWFREGYWRDRLRWEWEGRMIGGPGCWAEREEDEGEWAYERRKRAELAVARARRQNLEAGQTLSHNRSVSMIHLDDDSDDGHGTSGHNLPKVRHRRAMLRDLISLGKRSLSR